jgi:hypothetical protein
MRVPNTARVAARGVRAALAHATAACLLVALGVAIVALAPLMLVVWAVSGLTVMATETRRLISGP